MVVDDEYLEQKFTESGGTDNEAKNSWFERWLWYRETKGSGNDFVTVELPEGEKSSYGSGRKQTNRLHYPLLLAETDLESIIGLIPGANLIQVSGT